MEAARPATAADHERILALARDARAGAADRRGGRLLVEHDLRAEPLERSLTPAFGDPDEYLVAGTIDGEVVGYAVVVREPLRGGGSLGVLDEIYVEPGARGVGVGEAMMREVLTWCEARGCIGVDAVALPGDRQTKNFFEAWGLVARAILVHRSLEPPADHAG